MLVSEDAGAAESILGVRACGAGTGAGGGGRGEAAGAAAHDESSPTNPRRAHPCCIRIILPGAFRAPHGGTIGRRRGAARQVSGPALGKDAAGAGGVAKAWSRNRAEMGSPAAARARQNPLERLRTVPAPRARSRPPAMSPRLGKGITPPLPPELLPPRSSPSGQTSAEREPSRMKSWEVQKGALL